MQFEDDFEFDQIPDFLATFPDLKATVFPEKDTYTEDGMIECPFLALRDVVLYPQMVMPLFVGRERSLAAIKAAAANDENLIVSAQKDAELQDPLFDDIYVTGTEIVMGRTLRCLMILSACWLKGAAACSWSSSHSSSPMFASGRG